MRGRIISIHTPLVAPATTLLFATRPRDGNSHDLGIATIVEWIRRRSSCLINCMNATSLSEIGVKPAFCTIGRVSIRFLESEAQHTDALLRLESSAVVSM